MPAIAHPTVAYMRVTSEDVLVGHCEMQKAELDGPLPDDLKIWKKKSDDLKEASQAGSSPGHA